MRARPLVALALAGTLFTVAASALAFAGGTLVITRAAVDPRSPTLETDLRQAQVKEISKSGDAWHLYFVAYLKKAAGSKQLNVVFYEKGNKEPVNAFPVQTQPSAKIVMSDIEISPDQGFKPDHRYDVRITRLVGGKEDVFARAELELK